MKLVMKTLAVVAVCAGLVGCGERPTRPQVLKQEEGGNSDVAPALSKAVVNVVTKTNLANKKLTVKVDGNVVASECAGETLAKLDGATEKYKIVRQECDFGVRNVFVVSEYEAAAPAKDMEFTLVVSDEACSAASAKSVLVKTELEDESPKTDDATAKTAFFGFGAVMANM